MLQGHFIDTTLAPDFRDPDNTWYASWAFMRGLTAPVFFTTTGLVFIYLLLGDQRPPATNTRWRKGVRRGFMLIGIGYLLKVNVFAFLAGYIPRWFWALDVLHCIGMALLVLCGLFALARASKIPLGILTFTALVAIFFLDPSRKALDVTGLPLIMQNFVVKDFGSVFTPFPWVGYSCLGGLLGIVIRKRPQWAFGYTLPAFMIALGLAVHYYSSEALMELFRQTEWMNFRALAYNNTLIMRAGHTFILMALFMWVIARLPKIPPLVTKIGSETLTIYGVHYIILYGTWFGIGIGKIWYKELAPVAAILGAICFLVSFILMVRYLDQIREWIYVELPARIGLPSRLRVRIRNWM